MKVLVVGSTGGSGRAAVQQLLSAGHDVTAFSRREDRTFPGSGNLHHFLGDVMNAADVERAVRGQEAVVVTLGISENPFRVRLLGTARTPIDVRSAGTQNVIAAMQKLGVRKLVVQTSYGVGETRLKLGLVDRLFFELVLKPQIADTEKQEKAVRQSGLDWVIVQPVHLTDSAHDGSPAASVNGETATMKISRNSVGRFLADAAQSSTYIGKSVAISSPRR